MDDAIIIRWVRLRGPGVTRELRIPLPPFMEEYAPAIVGAILSIIVMLLERHARKA